MLDNSRPVNSNQTHLHPRLATVVQRHLHTLHRGQISDYSRRAYAHAVEALGEQPATARYRLLLRHRAQHRSVSTTSIRITLLSALISLLTDWASIAATSALTTACCRPTARISGHYSHKTNSEPPITTFFTPTPGRRPGTCNGAFTATPVCRTSSHSGGRVELRSNWQLYVEEFGSALHLAGHRGVCRTRFKRRHPP